MINISGIWKLINIEPLFTTRKLDLVLGVIVIGGIFTLIFERKAKYKELLVKYKNESFILLGWTYAIISLSMVIFLSI